MDIFGERIINLIPLKILRQLQPVNPSILNYHMVSDYPKPHIEHLYSFRDTTSFKRDIEYFISHHVPVDLDTLLNSLKKGVPPPAKSFHLTFDDGFREMEDTVTPILLEMGIPATFFLTTRLIDNTELQSGNKKSLLIHHIESNLSDSEKSHIRELMDSVQLPGSCIPDRIMSIPHHSREKLDQIASEAGLDFQKYLDDHKPYLTSEQVRSMLDKGFSIGGHSIDHPNYPELTLNEQLNQTLKSVDYLCDRFSVDYRVFSFPFSDKGISTSFFRIIENELDATFSNRGYFEDPVLFNCQRISVEKSEVAVRDALKYHYSRKLMYRLRKRHVIRRE